MRVLVTGAHGFVGHHVIRALRADGHDVVALVSPWGDPRRLATFPDLALVRADVADEASLLPAMAGVEVVVHAAAKVAEWGAWEPFHRANVLGTRSALRAATRVGVRRFVHVSTVAVSRYRGFLHADPRTAPRDGDSCAYARSKAEAEALVAVARGIETVIVRPGAWPFGPGDPTLPRLLAALAQPVFPLVRGGRTHLNTVFVENLAAGIALAARVNAAAGRLYLIADEGAPTWRDVLGELARLAGLSPRWWPLPGALAAAAGALTEAAWARFAPDRAPPIGRYAATLMRRDLHFSTEHARAELGFHPAVPWREGLARTVAAWRSDPAGGAPRGGSGGSAGGDGPADAAFGSGGGAAGDPAGGA